MDRLGTAQLSIVPMIFKITAYIFESCDDVVLTPFRSTYLYILEGKRNDKIILASIQDLQSLCFHHFLIAKSIFSYSVFAERCIEQNKRHKSRPSVRPCDDNELPVAQSITTVVDNVEVSESMSYILIDEQ